MLRLAGMSFVLGLVFLALGLAGAGFVAVPLWRARPVLAGAAGSAVLVLAGAAYFGTGAPSLALRDLEGPAAGDTRALIATLAARIRETPDDPRGWALLGRGYLAFGRPKDSAAAFARAVAIVRTDGGAAEPRLLSDYGEALAAHAGGVTREAEAVFAEAHAGDPAALAPRFYLGLAHADRGERDAALALWRDLLADTPPSAPWRRMLVDRIAVLSAGEGGAPDAGAIRAMVDGLAQRLNDNPDDAEGWLRLVRSYAVLGEEAKARDALSSAYGAMAGNAEARTKLDTLARELDLN